MVVVADQGAPQDFHYKMRTLFAKSRVSRQSMGPLLTGAAGLKTIFLNILPFRKHVPENKQEE